MTNNDFTKFSDFSRNSYILGEKQFQLVNMRFLLFIPFLLISISCNSNHSFEDSVGDIGAGYEMVEVSPTHQPPPPDSGSEVVVSTKIIKNGRITLQSEDVEKDYQSMQPLLKRFSAYIENENQTKSEYRVSYELVIRVASVHYDSLFNALTSLGVRLEHKTSNIEDVTERFYDLKTRIRNKKALENRYIELLNKATEVKDILEIERQINEVRTSIEQLEGQFNYLSKQISLSTIHLSFYEELPYTYASIQREGFGARLLNALDSGWQMFVSFIVGFTSLWPFLILAVIGFLILRRIRRSRGAKKI